MYALQEAGFFYRFHDEKLFRTHTHCVSFMLAYHFRSGEPTVH